MKAIAFLLLFSLTGFLPDSDKITWDSDRPLTWADYNGPKEPGSPHWASTNSGMGYTYGYSSREDDLEINFEVIAYMSPNKSWSIRDNQNDRLLAHEQLHFDITELHARKLRRALAEYEFSKDFKAEIKHIYKTILKASRDMQSRYDKETGHSRNKDVQAEWNEKIAVALKKMAKWTGHKFTNGHL